MLSSDISHEILQSIIEHNPDGIFILSKDGKITEINKISTNIFGFSKEELIGSNFHELIMDKHSKEFHDHLSQVLRGSPCESSLDGIHKTGEILHLSLKYIPLIEKTNFKGIFCVVKNITKMINSEKFKAVFHSTADAVDILDLDGNVLDVNHSFEELYGWKREEVIGKPLPIIPAERLDESISFIERAKRGENIREYDVACLRKDGTTADISLTFSPIRDSNGNIIALSGIARDITKLKQLKGDLNDSELRYRILADNSLDLIQLISLDGIVTYASPSHEAVLGYKSEEYVGKWVLHQPGTYMDVKFKDTFTNMFLTQKPFTTEIARIHKKGHKVWVELKGTPALDKDGNIKYMMLVGREITERKKLERHLEYLSFHDPLTGVPNRRQFKAKLKQTLKEAKLYNRKFAVMYMDIDKFKHINDTYGHDVGDELLKQFAKNVKSHLREVDIIGRQGGDEFTIILSDITDEQDARMIADQILTSFQEPWLIEGNLFQITSSIGIAFYPKDGTTKHDLLTHADAALYKAKNNGRNNYRTYS